MSGDTGSLSLPREVFWERVQGDISRFIMEEGGPTGYLLRAGRAILPLAPGFSPAEGGILTADGSLLRFATPSIIAAYTESERSKAFSHILSLKVAGVMRRGPAWTSVVARSEEDGAIYLVSLSSGERPEPGMVFTCMGCEAVFVDKCWFLPFGFV